MNEQPVPIGDLIDSVGCRVIDPQTMAMVTALRNEMMQELQNADPNEAENIRVYFEMKLQAVIDARGGRNCSDC